MRTLILLYTYKAYPKNETFSKQFPPQPLDATSDTYYANAIHGDCYTAIIKHWLEAGLIDAAKAIAIQYPKGHPRYSPSGVIHIADNFGFYILEDISQYESVHVASPSDILWIRGEPPWEPIIEQHQRSYKFYYNGASTEKWRPRYHVDAILVDNPSWSVPGVKSVEFIKCCDEHIFKPLGMEKTYDVCFIARFDQGDRKRQLEFAQLANKKWKAVFVGELADRDVVRELKRVWPSCEIIEHATKEKINEILNRSKVSVVNPRENDGCPRIIVESMAAGTPVIINRRNIGRKYLTKKAGMAVPTWMFRWALEWMLRRYEKFSPEDVYQSRYNSKLVADSLANQLFPPEKSSTLS